MLSADKHHPPTMTMKKTSLLTSFAFTAAVLSSCVYYTPPVADMPYKSNGKPTAYPNTWVTQPPAATTPAVAPAVPVPAPALPVGTAVGTPRTAAPVQSPAPKPAATPAPAPATKPLDLTTPNVTIAPEPPKPIVTPASVTPPPAPKPVVVPASAPVPTTAPAPAPAAEAKPAASASTASAAADPKSITNQGPIPVATRVEGDPTRVYNPLDPSKTIRVTDKTGKPYPSGKELKVRGTNFHFYVP